MAAEADVGLGLKWGLFRTDPSLRGGGAILMMLMGKKEA